MHEFPWQGVPEDDPAQAAARRAEAVKALQQPLPAWTGEDVDLEAFLHWVRLLVPGLVGIISLPIGIARQSGGAVMLGSGCFAILLSLGELRLRRRRRIRLFGRRGLRVGKALRGPALCFGIGLAVGGTTHLAGHVSLAVTWTLVGVGTAVPALVLLYRYWQDLQLSRWLGWTPRTPRGAHLPDRLARGPK